MRFKYCTSRSLILPTTVHILNSQTQRGQQNAGLF
jgi:hypothetical protein